VNTALGLQEYTLELLDQYFRSKTDIVKVIVYGSRAMGTYKPGSDIDLAVFSQVNEDISGKAKTDLEDLSTSYLFDVVDYAYLKHEGLKQHIERVGKIVYLK
jgi:uncharacterized protein